MKEIFMFLLKCFAFAFWITFAIALIFLIVKIIQELKRKK